MSHGRVWLDAKATNFAIPVPALLDVRRTLLNDGLGKPVEALTSLAAHAALSSARPCACGFGDGWSRGFEVSDETRAPLGLDERLS